MNQDFGIDIDKEVLIGFLDEALESLQVIDPLFVELEKSSDPTEIINTIFRPIHSLKGNAPFFGLINLKTISHELETLLSRLRDNQISVSSKVVDCLLDGVDRIRNIIDRVKQSKCELDDEESFNNFLHNLKLLYEESLQTAANKDFSKPSTNTDKPKPQTSEANRSDHLPTIKTMRVPEERIDTFLSFVGELIIVGETLKYFQDKLLTQNIPAIFHRDLSMLTESFSQLSTNLEQAIMSIRKVSLKGLLQKVPRIIRDVAKIKDKDINVVIIGDQIEVDKSIVELLDAPLTHMARNAADHGIEAPHVRVAANKSAQGLVEISCNILDQFLILEVKDDGAGLNYEALTKKALSLGIISPNQSLSEEDVINLLFMSGVSTANEVSEISGRGVGMDVVKKSIELAGGSLSVCSEKGKGCSFKIQIPISITTQIIQGLVVIVENNFLVIPLELVQEVWQLTDEIHILPDRRQFVLKNDTPLDFIDIGNFFGIKNSKTTSETIVTVNYKGRNLALGVDGILGNKQLVLKDISDLANRQKLFTGCALLGDGKIALVLDLDQILIKNYN